MATAVSPEDTSLSPVIPPSLNNDINSAVASGDPQSIYSLIPRAAGTGLESQLSGYAARAKSAVAPIENVLSDVQSKGGISTPDGRLTVAKSLADAQPETGFVLGTV